jgi:hypothetical protein
VIDPGPLARLDHVIAQPDTMSVIVQRLTDGEPLRAIARAWKVPYGRLAEWIVEDVDRTAAYERALRIWADSLAQEAVAIADEQAEVVKGNGETFDPNVARDKLRIETRLRLAGKWDRQRYGERLQHQHTGAAPRLEIIISHESMEGGRVLEGTPVASAAALPSPEEDDKAI